MHPLLERLLYGQHGRKSQFALDSREALEFLSGGRASKTGEVISVDTAAQVTTMMACARLISQGVAQTTLKFYSTGNRPGRIYDHPLLPVVTIRPNPWQTSFEFFETLLMHLAFLNNAYVFVSRVGSAREIRELIPLDPSKVAVKRNPDLSLVYTVTGDDGKQRTLGADVIWHLRGPSWNGWQGMEAIKYAREALGLARATEAKHATMHKNAPDPGGVYSVEGLLNGDQFKLLRDWIVKNTTGELSGSPLILDRGAKWVSQAMKGVDAQHLETRRFQVLEICRAMQVIPMMVGAAETPTYASAEQMFIAHVVHCITPWAERVERSAKKNLLNEGEAIDIRFDLKSLMRGAAADRASYYSAALGSGGSPAWMTQNEVREDDGLDWIEGGDELPKPTNVGGATGGGTNATV